MAKYMDIDAVKEAVRGAECDANWDGRRFDAEFIENALDFIPAADVVPVRHGHWDTGYFHDRMCSCCLHPDNDINDYAHDYCPNCGAKMDEEEFALAKLTRNAFGEENIAKLQEYLTITDYKNKKEN